MGKNLIAYIPTVNKRHKKWLDKHSGLYTNLFLISQQDAEKLLQRLERNEAALPTEIVVTMLRAHFTQIGRIAMFSEAWVGTTVDFKHPDYKHWILADEDVSELFAEKYLLPAGCSVEYENIWARYDMKAVIAQQPVIPDVKISTDEEDRFIMMDLASRAQKSPDWWRQIAAGALAEDGSPLACAYNTHLPNEYETYIFGDPAINRDAGQKGKSCALHSELAVIAQCAKNGLKLAGGTMFVTTFPCEGCAMAMVEAGVKELVFYEGYSSLNAYDILHNRRVKIVQLK